MTGRGQASQAGRRGRQAVSSVASRHIRSVDKPIAAVTKPTTTITHTHSHAWDATGRLCIRRYLPALLSSLCPSSPLPALSPAQAFHILGSRHQSHPASAFQTIWRIPRLYRYFLVNPMQKLMLQIEHVWVCMDIQNIQHICMCVLSTVSAGCTSELSYPSWPVKEIRSAPVARHQGFFPECTFRPLV